MYALDSGGEEGGGFPFVERGPWKREGEWPWGLLALPLVSVLVLLTCLGFVKRGVHYLFGQRVKPTTPVAIRKSIVSTSDSVVQTSNHLKLQGFRDHFQRISSDSYGGLAEEFERLKVDDTIAAEIADESYNRPKNRFVNILAFDHSRVPLALVDDVAGSDYINANYITGFHANKEYIATQGPLKSTTDDFWRMCWESEAKVIVMLTQCVDKEREKCHKYWPNSTMAESFGDIEVQVLREKLESCHQHNWVVTDIRIQRNETSRIVKHFQFLTWPDFGAIEPAEALVKFIRSVRVVAPCPKNQAEVTGRKVPPLIVHCSAGVGRSGTFIAVDIAMQQLKNLNTVDVFGIVYTMRRERVWMVQTEQQYICIYKCVLFLLEEDGAGSSSAIVKGESESEEPEPDAEALV